MKTTIEQIASGEDEVILHYRELAQEVEELIALLRKTPPKLIGMKGNTQVVVERDAILYAESVDGRTFLYTAADVVQVPFTLAQLEDILDAVNFFRCSKSMILNIDRVKNLRSMASNRIEATLTSGEKIIISRTYVAEFRRILKGGRSHA